MIKKIGIFLVCAVLVVGGVFAYRKVTHKNLELTDSEDTDESNPPPQPVNPTPHDLQVLPNDTSALGGYNVLIADRGNNRLIEVTPDKKIVWEYHFDNVSKPGYGADDSFFYDNGNSIIVNLELYHIIELLDYKTKQVTWSYGVPGKPGMAPGYLNTPDDAYKLPNGDLIVADIKNCRVVEINMQKQILHQYGVSGKCAEGDGLLNEPNGDTPLPNGRILISNIRGSYLVELDENWKQVFTMKLPVQYPSDPQMTKAGNILISDYSNPGQIVEVSRSGEVVWKYDSSTDPLNKPSLAEELPNGNILANDDFNHRVIVIDKTTNKIIWQYGVTGKPGSGTQQLNIPDGLDIIGTSHDTSSMPQQTYSVGYVMRHAQNLVGQQIQIQGYVLKDEGSYFMFSDESSGSISPNDLPVIKFDSSVLNAGQKYSFVGKLVSGGLNAVNKNIYHFEVGK